MYLLSLLLSLHYLIKIFLLKILSNKYSLKKILVIIFNNIYNFTICFQKYHIKT